MSILRIMCILFSMHVLFVMATTQEFFNTTPPAVLPVFSCLGRKMGYYADIDTHCQAYHTCDDYGNHFIHYCPEDTAFRQDVMICDHAYRVDCHTYIEYMPKYNVFRGLIQDIIHKTLPVSFTKLGNEVTNMNGHNKYLRINQLAKNFTSSKYLNKETDERKISHLFSIQESKTKSPKVRITPKSYRDDSSITVDHYTIPFNNLISTTQDIFSVDRQHAIELLEPSKVFKTRRQNKLSTIIPQLMRNSSISDFIQIEERKNYSFQKSLPEIEILRKAKVLDMFHAQGFGMKSNLNVFMKKPLNFLIPSKLRSNFLTTAKSNLNNHNDNYPYTATLKSIQDNKTNINPSTFNMPLIISTSITSSAVAKEASSFSVSSDTDYDPYYPNLLTTTEVYYSPSQQIYKFKKPYITTNKPVSKEDKFEIPSILPDLNSLEDLLDRKKLFFIPRVKPV